MADSPLVSITSFGEMLKYLRKRAGLTLLQFGLATGYSESLISKLEGGQRLPDPFVVKTQFIAALDLRTEPELATRLFDLAIRARDAEKREAQSSSVSGDAHAVQRTNIQPQLTPFIGRKREVAEVQRLVGANRLVTLTGAGGVGKTRLALQVAHALMDDYADGVWLVAYASVMDAGLVVQTNLGSLNLLEQPNQTPLEVLLTYLAEKAALLIFDNCEHLIGACAELAEALLRGCPKIRILATSRETPGVPGEVVWRVPSMQTPDLTQLPPLAQARELEAMQLFISVASATRPDFALTEDNLECVAQICHHLDGIPLAIEMAAAQVAVLSEHEIATGLAKGLALLTSGSRGALPRHRTLRATLDWSYTLLSESERVLLARLSVFVGGWTTDAAQAICADDKLTVQDCQSALLQLAQKSLVVVTMRNRHTRYHLLDTIRQYAVEKQRECGETSHVRERHLSYYLAISEGTMDLGGYRFDDWLRRVEPEHDNVRAAFNWARERAGTDAGEMMLRVAAAMRPFWCNRGFDAEGVAWLDEALAQGSHAPEHARGRALLAKASLLDAQWEDTDANKVAAEGLAICRACNDDLCSAWCLAIIVHNLDPGEGDPHFMAYAEEALRLFNEAGCLDGAWRALYALGNAACQAHNHRQAKAYYEKALKNTHELRDASGSITTLGGMHHVDRKRALELDRQELDYQRQDGNRLDQARCLNTLGCHYLIEGDCEQAQVALEESYALLHQAELNDRYTKIALGRAICFLGFVDYIRGDFDQAILHWEQSSKLCKDAMNTYYATITLVYIGAALIALERIAQAQDTLHHVLRDLCEQRRWYAMKWAFKFLACLEHLKGRLDHAACLIGAADALGRSYNQLAIVFYTPTDPTERTAAEVRTQLGDEAYEAEYAIGQKMTVDEAVAYALEW